MAYTITDNKTHALVTLVAFDENIDIQQLKNELNNYPALILNFTFSEQKQDIDLLQKFIETIFGFCKQNDKILVVVKPGSLKSSVLDKKQIEWAPTLSEATDLIFMLLIEKEL